MLYFIVLRCILSFCKVSCRMYCIGLVWFGLVWFGLVWSGLVWFGLVWFGLVCMIYFMFVVTVVEKNKFRIT